jgi:L-ascorbate metabolism protein UlaG (beta-lactamase superfamily)
VAVGRANGPQDRGAARGRVSAAVDERLVSNLCKNRAMELTWYGRTCVRMRGKDAVVVADAYQSVVGPTGRGITGDIVTYSHPDDAPPPKARGRMSRDGTTPVPGSLEAAFCLDGPGEYEVRDVLIAGVRTYRDDHRGTERGRNVAFIVELDGVHVIHLGDIGHLLTEDKLTDIGPVDVACIPVGGTLSATKAAELVAQLDVKVVVPMAVCDDDDSTEALAKFMHEMGVPATPALQSKLALMPSTLPAEVTTVLLEQRGKV